MVDAQLIIQTRNCGIVTSVDSLYSAWWWICRI